MVTVNGRAAAIVALGSGVLGALLGYRPYLAVALGAGPGGMRCGPWAVMAHACPPT
jgi:hypothetical protein